MKKSLKLVTMLIIFALALSCAAGALTLEQVQASPPSFDVYIYGDGADLSGVGPESVKATIGDLSLDCTDVSRSEQGIFYIFMLDISGSIPADYFEAAKSAVIATCDTLREQDKLAIITFGNEVTVLHAGEDDVADVRDDLENLVARDSRTMFYTAMDKLIETATQTTDMRRVAVVISDGVDDTDAGMTQAELEDELKNCGISVYALCIDTSGMTEQFGDFIRLSGGELYTFNPDTAQSVLDELLSRLGDSLCIRLMTSETVPEGAMDLTVDLGEAGSVTTQLTSDKWVADATEPYITSAQYSLENQTIDLSFSEPVIGADDVSRYTLSASGGGAAVSISAAAYTDGRKTAVSLSFAQLPLEGQYKLTASGITDASVAANPLREYTSTVMLATGVKPENEQSDGAGREIVRYVIIAVVAIALIIFLIGLISRLNKLTDKTEKDSKLSEEDKRKLKKAEKTIKTETFVFANAVKKPDKPAAKEADSTGDDDAAN